MSTTEIRGRFDTATFDEDDRDVVVIVGSGPGGGTLAHELCERGIRCVVLDYDALKGVDSSEHRLF